VIASTGATPRFSPVLLFGLAVQALPLAPLQPILSRIMTGMVRRHPDVFERLSGVAEPRYLIDPVDLPFCFLLVLDEAAPTLKAVRDAGSEDVAARIRGPLQSLVDLLEGKSDGDALFFSRTLVVEGNTEAVVALRNALDGCEINLLSDLLQEAGPLAGPVHGTINLMRRVYEAASRDMASIQGAINAPSERRADILSAKVNRLGDNIDDLKRRRRREKTE